MKNKSNYISFNIKIRWVDWQIAKGTTQSKCSNNSLVINSAPWENPTILICQLMGEWKSTKKRLNSWEFGSVKSIKYKNTLTFLFSKTNNSSRRFLTFKETTLSWPDKRTISKDKIVLVKNSITKDRRVFRKISEIMLNFFSNNMNKIK